MRRILPTQARSKTLPGVAGIGRRDVAVAVGGLWPNRAALNTKNTARREGRRRFMVFAPWTGRVSNKRKAWVKYTRCCTCVNLAPARNLVHMPELPDISAYITALEERIVGQTLERVRLGSVFLLRTVDPPLSAVEGRTVREAAAHREADRDWRRRIPPQQTCRWDPGSCGWSCT